MQEKRVKVWVQRFADRKHLMLQWIDPATGKRKSLSTGTDDEAVAEDRRADHEYELNHGQYQEPSKMSWDAFREAFEKEYVVPLRPQTRDNYEDTLNQFERLCSPRRLQGVTTRTVSEFAAKMRQQECRGRTGMAPGTIKVRLQFLRTALRWAVEQGMLPECPKFPKLRVPERVPQAVPEEDFQMLLAKAPDDQTRAFLLCGWLAGLRLREAFSLEWEPTEKAPYVSFGQRRIVLPAGFVKGVRDQWVPLDPALEAALKLLPRQGRKVFRFTDPRNGREIGPTALSDRVTALAKEAGLKMTMHSLRRGFGSRYAAKVPAQVLQKLMRHKKISTTMEYYVNVDDAVEAAVLGQRNTSRNSQDGA